MVAEMMILTGEIAARYGEDNEIPLPFRSQPQPELPPEEELMQLEAGWVRDSAVRRCMTRSEMSITSARPATLGLDRYCQVTSPIRRYTDLMGHFQIKAHLRGEALPFTPTEMPEIIASVSNAAYEGVMVERQTKKYWAIEFLRRQDEVEPGKPWDVMMVRWLREHESLGLIIFEDLGLEFVMRFDRAVEVGERLVIRLSYADPRQEMVRFKEVITATEQEEVAESEPVDNAVVESTEEVSVDVEESVNSAEKAKT